MTSFGRLLVKRNRVSDVRPPDFATSEVYLEKTTIICPDLTNALAPCPVAMFSGGWYGALVIVVR